MTPQPWPVTLLPTAKVFGRPVVDADDDEDGAEC